MKKLNMKRIKRNWKAYLVRVVSIVALSIIAVSSFLKGMDWWMYSINNFNGVYTWYNTMSLVCTIISMVTIATIVWLIGKINHMDGRRNLTEVIMDHSTLE